MNKVYLVGGDGYIGSRLAPFLVAQGYEPEVIDAGVFGGPAHKKRDVREMPPPGDGEPVVWLATIHREPRGLSAEQVGVWRKTMESLMYEAPLRWHDAGHPVLYLSSMLVVTDPEVLYAQVKNKFEKEVVGRAGVRVLRLGTVWGGFELPGTFRPETAVNAFLLGKKLSRDYWAYTCHMDSALAAIAGCVPGPYHGDVLCITDHPTPTTGQMLLDACQAGRSRGAPFDRRVWREQSFAERVARRLKKETDRLHVTARLAAYYRLPWPEKESTKWTL